MEARGAVGTGLEVCVSRGSGIARGVATGVWFRDACAEGLVWWCGLEVCVSRGSVIARGRRRTHREYGDAFGVPIPVRSPLLLFYGLIPALL